MKITREQCNFQSADVSMIGNGCGVSQNPHIYVQNK